MAKFKKISNKFTIEKKEKKHKIIEAEDISEDIAFDDAEDDKFIEGNLNLTPEAIESHVTTPKPTRNKVNNPSSTVKPKGRVEDINEMMEEQNKPSRSENKLSKKLALQRLKSKKEIKITL